MAELIKFERRLKELQSELSERVNKIKLDLNYHDDSESTNQKEQSTEMEATEVLLALKSEAEEELEMISSALLRLSNGTYGTCTRCGEDIEANRLKAVPFANHCISCQQKVE